MDTIKAVIFSKIWKLVSVILFFPFVSYAQNERVNLEVFGINRGLSQDYSNCVIQDSKGLIWIATQDGLNRFDGYKFKIYKRKISKENSLIDNFIYSLCEDGDSAMWIATSRGLSKYRYKTDDFESYENEINNQNSLHTNSIRAILKGRNGKLWIKSEKGIDRFDPVTKEFVYFQHPFDEFSFSSPNNNFALIQDENGNLWTSSKDGLVFFDVSSEQFSVFKPNSDGNTLSNEVFSLFLTPKNNILVGTKSGVYLFYKESKNFKLIFSKLQGYVITSLYKDSKGTFWIGTDHGLYSADGYNSTVKIFDYMGNDEFGVNSFITSITEDDSKILWVTGENGLMKIDTKKLKFNLLSYWDKDGMDDFLSGNVLSVFALNKNEFLLGLKNKGLIYLNKKTSTIINFNKENSPLEDNNINVIKRDPQKRIILGTDNGVFSFDEKEKKIKFCTCKFITFLTPFFKNNRITDILYDTKNRYWIATLNGLYLFDNDSVMVYSNKSKGSFFTPGIKILKIIQRKNGQIWAASDNGLMFYEEEKGSFKIYTEQPSGLSHFSVLSINEIADNTLWVGTEFGLNKYDQDRDTFIIYNSENTGFANDYICAMLEDENQNLWLSTKNGIIKFNHREGSCVNYRPEHGLQGYEYNTGVAFKTKDGEMFFGGLEGINHFYPDEVVENTYAPKIIFTELEIFYPEQNEYRSLIDSDTITMKYDEYIFNIYFTMPEYTYLYQNTFKCKMEGLSKGWQDIGTQNYFTLNKIPPGKYKLQVKGFNSDNVESSQIAELVIIISSSWWVGYWAIGLYVVTGILIVVWIFFAYNRKVRMENRKLLEKQKISDKIKQQKEELSIKNKNISDSIRYAKRIIDAMMPSEKTIKTILPESFIFFKPKDIVSGDFYWADSKNGIIYVAVVDCTGHGVPGAFMSIVGLNLLRDILSLGFHEPAKILDLMDKNVKEIFISKEKYSVKDGMDMAICAINREQKILQFAGAKNPLFLIRDNSIIKYKGDRFPVGPENDEHEKFKNNVIPLEDDDIIYLFSDGYADQFGGPMNKKFKYRRFRSVLLDIYQNDMEAQKNELKEIMAKWKKDEEQVDDILIMGIKPLSS